MVLAWGLLQGKERLVMRSMPPSPKQGVINMVNSEIKKVIDMAYTDFMAQPGREGKLHKHPSRETFNKLFIHIFPYACVLYKVYEAKEKKEE